MNPVEKWYCIWNWGVKMPGEEITTHFSILFAIGNPMEKRAW